MIWDALRRSIDTKARAWVAKEGLTELPAFALEEPPAGFAADAACNLALVLAKPLRKSPRAIAQALQTVLAADEHIEKIEIAGAGFLNLTLKLGAFSMELKTVRESPRSYGRRFEGGQKILLEYVSANPTGPLHVGHGRGAALGDSLGRILEHLGNTVQREYYINDAGNQVQLLGVSVLERCKEALGQPFQMPEEGYLGGYIKDVAKAWLAEHPGVLPDVAQATGFALKRLLAVIEKDLTDFGLHFDRWFSEASLLADGRVERHIQTLRQRGFVQDYDGAVWFVAPGTDEGAERDKDRVLKRKDGRWTYFATDIAYHADKAERGFDRLIDIWGADHHGYVARVTGSLQALGYDPARLHVVLYQLVSLTRGGVPISMSKRSGDFISLREVLDEVGRDACRFFFALRGPNTALDFDLELAKKHTNENPVYYLQYAHARICSIFRQAAEQGIGASEKRSAGAVFSDAPTPRRSDADLSLLSSPEERAVLRKLSLFPQTLQICAQEDSPHPLAVYLLALAREFHYFYDHHRVLGVEPTVSQARLALLDGVRAILALGLELLGVSAPESM